MVIYVQPSRFASVKYYKFSCKWFSNFPCSISGTANWLISHWLSECVRMRGKDIPKRTDTRIRSIIFQLVLGALFSAWSGNWLFFHISRLHFSLVVTKSSYGIYSKVFLVNGLKRRALSFSVPRTDKCRHEALIIVWRWHTSVHPSGQCEWIKSNVCLVLRPQCS